MDGALRLGGHDVAYETYEGRGPALVLVHGLGSRRRTWDRVLAPLLAAGRQVVTVDLPGHGDSGPGRGDFSLGAFASVVRDLLDELGIGRAVLVGHSLGGGVALQFVYQYRERCAGLVLVASGGLGRDASALLRAASLPGAGLVLPLLTHDRTLGGLAALGRIAAAVPGAPGTDALDGAGEALRELQDPQARQTFLATVRSVIDRSGQRVSAVESLPAVGGIPTLLVWGDRDPILPMAHGVAALEQLPGARLVVFPGCGHEPQRYDPQRLAELVIAHAELVSRREAGLRSTRPA